MSLSDVYLYTNLLTVVECNIFTENRGRDSYFSPGRNNVFVHTSDNSLFFRLHIAREKI